MRHEVRMRIRGLMPEKLIERARETGVRFMSIEPGSHHEITVEVGAADAEKLSALCARFSIPCEVLSRRGKSALAAALRRRWTLLIGILVMLAACWALLGRVWRVDVRFIGDSAARGDPAAVAEALREMGVHAGMARDIDPRILSEALLSRCEGLSYAGARLQGVRLSIEAAPETASPEVYDVRVPRDLYADRCGIVVSVNVESGQPCVKPGDTVRRGQLLIRGEEKRTKEETRGIAALGEVIVRAWFEGSARGDMSVERWEDTGRVSTAATLKTPWLNVPITEGMCYAHQSEQVDNLPIGGLYIPVGIERVTRRERRVRREAAHRDALIKSLSALAVADARARLFAAGIAKYEIARCWTRVNAISEDALEVSAVLEITTNTAVTAEALRQGG